MASDPPPAHRTASTPKKPTSNPTGRVIITVGASESTSRTWTLSQATLAQHSSYYRHLLAAEPLTSHTLLFATTRSFSNFVDYLHSGIYSTNTQVANYSATRAHTDACILGAKLGVKGYRESAIRALHKLFEPPDQSVTLGPIEGQRTITEADLEYVCIHAEEEFLPPDVEDVGALTGLRHLFFDALAVHWGRRRVLDIRGCRIDAGAGAALGSNTTWVSLWFAFPEFAERVGGTWRVMGRNRRGLLKEPEEYFCVYEGDTDVEEEGEGSGGDADGEDEDGDVIMDKGKGKARAKESYLNRRKNGESKRFWLKVRGLRSKSNIGQTEKQEEEGMSVQDQRTFKKIEEELAMFALKRHGSRYGDSNRGSGDSGRT